MEIQLSTHPSACTLSGVTLSRTVLPDHQLGAQGHLIRPGAFSYIDNCSTELHASHRTWKQVVSWVWGYMDARPLKSHILKANRLPSRTR